MAPKQRYYAYLVRSRKARKEAEAGIKAATLRVFRKTKAVLIPELRGLHKIAPVKKLPWSEEFYALWETEFNAAVEEAMTGIGAVETAEFAAHGFTPNVDWTSLLRQYQEDNQLPDDTIQRVEDAINEWYGNDKNISSLVADLSKEFSEVRATRIAVTEVTSLHSAITKDLMQSSGIGSWEWHGTLDDWECFPENTKVITASGNSNIQDIVPGDKILSRIGIRQVISTNCRDYKGEWSFVISDNGILICTANHPVWVIKKGWLNACNLQVGDFVQFSNNNIGKIWGCRNFFFEETDNSPSVFRKIIRFAQITFRVTMPICSVYLNSYFNRWYSKVNRIAIHRIFLIKFQLKRLQDLTNRLFNSSFAFIFSKTGKGTETAVNIAWNSPEQFITGQTIYHHWWSTTILRTKATDTSFTTSKSFTATFAVQINSISLTADQATNSITVSNLFRDSKLITTNRTNLSNHFSGPTSFIALARTKGLAIYYISIGGIKRLATIFTSKCSAVFSYQVRTLKRTIIMCRWLSFTRQIMGTIEFFSTLFTNIGGHIRQLQILSNILYHGLQGISTKVYNLQIEDDPTYFAENILVHNCDFCRDNEGKIFTMNDPMPPDASHPNCYCGAFPAWQEEKVDNGIPD